MYGSTAAKGRQIVGLLRYKFCYGKIMLALTMQFRTTSAFQLLDSGLNAASQTPCRT